MLILIIFIFDRTFQPILTVQIHDDTALVKPVMTLMKFRLYNETKIFLLCLHLQYRSIVILKMIISSLPQIRMRFRNNLNCILADDIMLRLSRPFKFV